MPSQYPLLNASKIAKVLEELGFSKVSQKGSHMKYSDGVHIAIVPNHDPVPRWTFKNILKQANISLDDFMDKL